MKRDLRKERNGVVLKMKKEQKKNKKLALLILLLLMTGTMLATSTYAWFTSNESVSVNEIQVNVAATGGIQLSADGTNWKTIVLTSDLTGVHGSTYTGSVNQIPSVLEPVSTGLNVSATGKLEMFYGEVTSNESGDFILTSTQSNEAEGTSGKFIAFDLFVKSESATNLYMTGNSGVVNKDTQDKGIKNASRIAFVVLGNTTTDATVASIQALGTSGASASPVFMWEPNYDVHTTNGIANARDTYGITVTQTGNASPVAYDGVVAAITAGDNVKLGEANATHFSTKFASVTPTYTTVEGSSSDFQIFNLAAGVTKLRVYMWVEGQDVDCENTASGGNIAYNIGFTITAPANNG